jgi:flagellar biogenesis protein FliO
MLMDVLNSIVVIGIANNQITMLTTISDPKSLEQLKNTEREKKSPISLLNNLSSYRSRLLAQGHKRKGLKENE